MIVPLSIGLGDLGYMFRRSPAGCVDEWCNGQGFQREWTGERGFRASDGCLVK